MTPIGVQQDGGEKIAKDAIKVVHLDADSTTTDYVLKFLGSVFIGCVGAETDGRLSRSLGHSHTAHGVERLSGHPVWNGDLRKNATGLLYRLLYINPCFKSTGVMAAALGVVRVGASIGCGRGVLRSVS